MVGLVFFVGVILLVLDLEKDVVLLGVGVWCGIRRERKSYR